MFHLFCLQGYSKRVKPTARITVLRYTERQESAPCCSRHFQRQLSHQRASGHLFQPTRHAGPTWLPVLSTLLQQHVTSTRRSKVTPTAPSTSDGSRTAEKISTRNFYVYALKYKAALMSYFKGSSKTNQTLRFWAFLDLQRKSSSGEVSS